MKNILITILLSFLFVSCATKKEIEYVDREVVKMQHDTLVVDVHDSVFHTIYQKGDTIYNTKYVEKIKYKDRIVVKNDTCYLDKVQIIEVEKKIIPKWCYYSLLITIVLLIFASIKLYKWIRR